MSENGINIYIIIPVGKFLNITLFILFINSSQLFVTLIDVIIFILYSSTRIQLINGNGIYWSRISYFTSLYMIFTPKRTSYR